VKSAPGLVHVIGVGMTPFCGVRQDANVRDMVVEAVRAALVDAGATTEFIDLGVAAYESDHFNRQLSLGHFLAEAIGLQGTPVLRVEGGGATGALAIRSAATAIKAGEAEAVLVFGGETNGRSVDRATATEILAMSADFDWETPVFGTFAAPYALMIIEHMRRYGTTAEQFAAIAVKNRRTALDNPLAHKGMSIAAELGVAEKIIPPSTKQSGAL
jgi:acetyl-CoA C-acetyltransferase